MNPDFTRLTALASYPLCRGYECGPPVQACSSTIVHFGDHRLVLTVSHAAKPDKIWAIQLQYEPPKGTKHWKIGSIQYMLEIGQDWAREVGSCFAPVPTDLVAKWQRFSDHR